MCAFLSSCRYHYLTWYPPLPYSTRAPYLHLFLIFHTFCPHLLYRKHNTYSPECHEQEPHVYYLQTEREQLFCFHLGHFRQVNQGSSLNFRLSVDKFLAYLSAPRCGEPIWHNFLQKNKLGRTKGKGDTINLPICTKVWWRSSGQVSFVLPRITLWYWLPYNLLTLTEVTSRWVAALVCHNPFRNKWQSNHLSCLDVPQISWSASVMFMFLR